MAEPVVPIDRNVFGHPLAGLLWERQFEQVLLDHGWNKFQTGNVHLSTEQENYSYQCIWDDIKLAGKKQNIDPMWKITHEIR